MQSARPAYLVPVFGLIAVLVLGQVVYAGVLTADWGTFLACTPAILVTIGIVGGMLCGMLFFEADEDETPAEASRPDGTAIFDWIARLVH